MTRRLTAAFLIILGLAILFPAQRTSARHDTWFEVRTPNFIVVSNAGEKLARKTAIRFEQIRGVFRRSLPIASVHASPVITILAVKDEDSMKALLPEYWAKGHMHPAGVFVDNLNQYFAAVEMDAPGENPYNTIYHEYYHSLTTPYLPNLPLWVAEGMAEFYGDTAVTDSEVRMGQADSALINELREGKLIPLDVLFKVDASSPYYNEQNKTSVFYAESWALIHYLMVGDKASHRPMLAAYLNEISQGVPQGQAAAKAFGDLKQLQATLNSYTGKNSFFYLKDGPPPAVSESDFKVRELSEAEADAYRAGFAAVRGKPAEAITLATAAVKLDPKLALGYQYLGLAEYESGQPKEALADLTRAIEIEPKNALTRFLRAYLSTTSAGGITDDDRVEADLRAAIAANPDFAPPYGMLAVYLATRGQNLPEALSFAQKGVNLQPGNPAFQIDLAQVLQRMGKNGEARSAALAARANATDPGQRAQAEQFLKFLEAAQRASAGGTGGAVSGPGPQAASRDSNSSAPANANSTSAEGGSSNPNMRQATGVVTKVSCMNGVKMELKTDAGVLRLAIKPGTQIRIEMAEPSQGQFNLCTSLPGQRATVDYEPDNAKGTSGSMAKIRVLNDQNVRKLAINSGAMGGVTSSVEGNVKDVTCTGNELLMTLDAPDGFFTLHARDATRVPYEKGVAFDNGEFQACSQLQGHQAKVTFVAADNEKFDGEIQSVEILK